MEEKYFELNLPSNLLLYEGVKKVEIRMLKGKDEKLISDIDLSNFEKKFKLVLDGVIRGIEPEKLTLGDRIYILVWIAMNCYSPLYSMDLICDTCLVKSPIEIDLGKLEKLELPKKFKEPYEITLMDKTKIKLRLLRVADQIQYLDHVQEKEDNSLYKLAQSIVDDKDLVTRIKMLEEMSTKDLALIRAFHEKYYHGVKLETKYTCPKCGGTGNTPVPFRLDIIFPAGETVAKSLGRSI